MKVILQKNVPNLGDAGEIKEVAAGYARNYLLPRNLVIPAHAGSVKAVQHQQQMIQRKRDKNLKEMAALGESLNGIGELELQVRVGAKNKLFGSVTSMNISKALQEKGYGIDKRKIEISEKIRALGKYKVKVRLAENIIVPLSLNIVADQASQEALEKEAAEEQERLEREAADERARAEAAAAEEAGEGSEDAGENTADDGKEADDSAGE